MVFVVFLHWLSLVVVSRDPSAWQYMGFALRQLLFVAEHRLQACGCSTQTCGPWSLGSVVVAHRLSCAMAYRIFPHQGSNPVPCIGRQIPIH